MTKVRILLCNGREEVIKIDDEKCSQLIEWFQSDTFPGRTIAILTKNYELNVLTTSIIAIEVIK